MDANRREDLQTRKAINIIQNMMFDPAAYKDLFQALTTQTSIVSEADIAVCTWAGEHCFDPSSVEEKPQYYFLNEASKGISHSVFNEFLVKQKLPQSPVIYDDNIPQQLAVLFKSKCNISSAVFIPVESYGQFLCYLILGKVDKQFGPHIIQRLGPIVGATICSVQTAESVRGSFGGLDQKLSSDVYLSSLISSSPSGIVVVKEDKTILLTNPSALEMIRSNNEDMINSLVGLPIENFFPDYDLLFQWSSQKDKYGLPSPAQVPILWENQPTFLLDGTTCFSHITVFKYRIAEQYFTTLQIVKVPSSLPQKLPETPFFESDIVQLIPMAVLQLDADWSCVFSNEKWYEVSGLADEECMAGKWLDAFHPDDASSLFQELKLRLRSGTEYRHEARIMTPLGATKWMDFHARVLLDDHGKIAGYLCTFLDISDYHKNTEKLQNVVNYDVLTGLANRTLLQDRLQQAFFVSEREGSLVSLMFLDLDGFKNVNDNLGHDAGDLVLKLVAERLVDVLRRNDTVARFGGDEFVILLGHDDHITEIFSVAEKIINVISLPYAVYDTSVNLTVSIGVSEGSFVDSNPQQLIKQADSALYLAKNDGRNNYKMFDEKLDAKARERMFLTNQLRRGLKQERFSLYYQPICMLKTGKIAGFEALLRFSDVNEKLVMPNDFIPLLEETGLIVDVGKWIIREACRQIADWKLRDIFPEDGYVSFNVSSKQFSTRDIYEVLASSIKKNELKPENLIMEMTESILIDSVETANSLIADVRALGVRIALDDFGTGYSSLSYLQTFPFDFIKIDKSFIDNLELNTDNLKITKAIIALAHSLGLGLIAEGVENKASLEILASLGVQKYQGYYLSPPIERIRRTVFFGKQNNSQPQ